MNGSFCNLGKLAFWLGLVLTSPKKGEAAVCCCDPALSVLVMLVSRKVFHVLSALKSIVCLYTIFWLIRSLVDPTLRVGSVYCMWSLAVFGFILV